MLSKVLVNADGGSRGNPGPAAIGIVIWDEKRNRLETFKQRIGVATNNMAEYSALVKALQLAAKHTGDIVAVFMDSELVIRQLKGEYKVKSIGLKPLFDKVKKLESSFKRVAYHNVSRDDRYQSQADELVNEALDSE